MNQNETLNYLSELKSFGIQYHDDIKLANNTHKPTTHTKPTTITQLNTNISNCYLCELHKQSRHKHQSNQNQSASVVFVGDYSANNQDPYLGQTGKMLENICQNVLKLSKEEVYITNIIKCPITDSSLISTQCINMCKGYLQDEIDIIKPKVVVCFDNKTSANLNIDLQNSKLIRTHSLGYLLRNPSQKQKTLDDMKKVYSILDAL